MNLRIGVLALQGGFAAHESALRSGGYDVTRVRTPADAVSLDGLVLPGGESTAQWRLLVDVGLDRVLVALVAGGLPIVATCAGLILAAKTVRDPDQASLGLLDVAVRRNGWGKHVDSFEAVLDRGGRRGVFIRAPRIESMGPAVEVLDTLRGEPVLIRQGSVFGATFHPELIEDGAVYAEAFGS